jgi:hypothetical protein
MPAIWGLKPLTDRIESDKEVRLSTGVVVDLSDFNIRADKKPSDKQISDIVARVQANMDVIEPLAAFPDDEPHKTISSAELQALFGGRVFLDGSGNIVMRTTLFSLTWEDGRLMPHWSRVI